jgi:hypothetical protein
MSPDNSYTFQELKDFTNDFTDLTILNISNFIEVQTKSKYAVVERKMIVDLTKQFFNNNMAMFKIQSFLYEVWNKNKEDPNTQVLAKDVENFLTIEWSEVTSRNHIIVSRWKKQLEEFE